MSHSPAQAFKIYEDTKPYQIDVDNNLKPFLNNHSEAAES